MELTLILAFKFYTSVAKVLKLKVREFWELITTFVEVTGLKLSNVCPCQRLPEQIKKKKKFEGNFLNPIFAALMADVKQRKTKFSYPKLLNATTYSNYG